MKRLRVLVIISLAALIAGGLTVGASPLAEPPRPQVKFDPLLPPADLDTDLPYVPNEVLVKLRPGRSLEAALSHEKGLLASIVAQLSKHDPHLYRVQLPDGANVEEVAARLSDSADVEYVEPHYILRLAVVPNDPLYNSQQNWYYDLLHASIGWDIEQGKPSILVAVIDSGIDLDHEDLDDNLWFNFREVADRVDNDENGYIDDLIGWNFLANSNDPNDDHGQGHGTFVAGLIAAEANNRIGVAGVAWNVKLMPLKVTDAQGNVKDVRDVADAIRYAGRNGARVINISLAGGCEPIQTLSQAISEVQRLYGTIVVAAAGNQNRGCVSHPAADPAVIAVGAFAGPVVRQSNAQSGFACEPGIIFDPNNRAIFTSDGAQGSNWGPEIDLAAPGQCVTSTSNGLSLGDYTNQLQGTSFSAPIVSGLAALLLSQDPNRTEAHVRQILCASAINMPDGDTPNWDGCGRVDIGGALTYKPYQSFAPGIMKD